MIYAVIFKKKKYLQSHDKNTSKNFVCSSIYCSGLNMLFDKENFNFSLKLDINCWSNAKTVFKFAIKGILLFRH